ncbi:MAG: phospholipid/cholesterol/gamma-HCH transport system substrate-binding protein [Thermoleophilaceae bacterium]|nr:phospholipid/cholesterol/gamma-HCH transport system substrate-binding protein [Thermoleophilaceae bacterium]
MRANRPSVLGSPVLVGAITVLIVVVGVFLAYNANKGLPFVPTYDVNAHVPSAADLVVGNDVRVGGDRVGIVNSIKPVRTKDGKVSAILGLKLDKTVDPLATSSTVIVRPRSALGLKYVEITPGRSRKALKAGDTLPLSSARPVPVEIDEVFNTFSKPTRAGITQSLRGYGDGFAGRGVDLNVAIGALKPLLQYLDPVARNLASPQTRLARFFRALNSAASEVAPVAETQAALFRNLDTTFTALATVAKPFIQDTITQSPPTEQAVIKNFPLQRPFLENSAALFHELRPGVATLPTAMPILADALDAGVKTLPKTPAFNAQVADVFRTLDTFIADPAVPRGIKRLDQTVTLLNPTLDFVTPAQTTCNYITLWFRNIASLLSEGDKNGTWQRFIIVATPQGPNNEGASSSAPANGPSTENHLHANPYPNTASPGQTPECEAGNEDYIVGKTTIGNVPGNQGTVTQGQVK